MSAYDTSHSSYGVASFANRTVAFISDTANSIRAWNDARITCKALTSLTDHELADIGLERGDIETISRSYLIR